MLPTNTKPQLQEFDKVEDKKINDTSSQMEKIGTDSEYIAIEKFRLNTTAKPDDVGHSRQQLEKEKHRLIEEHFQEHKKNLNKMKLESHLRIQALCESFKINYQGPYLEKRAALEKEIEGMSSQLQLDSDKVLGSIREIKYRLELLATDMLQSEKPQ
ncbi:hypothetical protein NADFUDRAFT_39314 [Nadsonia fulvescens var. elongata DSM 6958]|uniref:Uncharacterized protein n=1 Tax=Nadsonia fulvescens var. elongata DSM 6958 TaxID=857566 RepID=A0A1E3PR60_9ASCO|nr:hypothetical protein NADFUDRAFT_39314 [Nadsonia fulvescens var. elongata DSM 6958]